MSKAFIFGVVNHYLCVRVDFVCPVHVSGSCVKALCVRLKGFLKAFWLKRFHVCVSDSLRSDSLRAFVCPIHSSVRLTYEFATIQDQPRKTRT